MPRSSFATMVVAFISLFVVSCAAAQEACKLSTSGVATVISARDGRTLLLADGRELRLAGIEVTDDSRAALELLVGGRDVRLEQSGSKRDRYGRVVAFVYLEDTGQSVQRDMLERGQARVSAQIGEKRCADFLLGAERAARAAHRGLWADPNFAPLRSENTSQIAAAQGQFALVEGKVLSVRESGATMYLNFGRRWTRDFTVTVLKRRQREFTAAGIDLKRLEGQPVRVRGWIEQHGGPIIDAIAPVQIEFVE